MAKNEKRMLGSKNFKKMMVLLFLAGYLFGQPIVASVGAIGWGVLTLKEIFGK